MSCVTCPRERQLQVITRRVLAFGWHRGGSRADFRTTVGLALRDGEIVSLISVLL